MSEYWDVYDAKKNKTGKTILRGSKLESNEYHLIVHVWIKLKNGKFLITRRSYEKDLYPGLWEITGGCVISEESSKQAAIREVKEETGLLIKQEDLHYFRTYNGLNNFSNHFVDIFIAIYNNSIEELVFQKEEIDAYKIVDKHEIEELINERQFVPDVKEYINDIIMYCEEI